MPRPRLPSTIIIAIFSFFYSCFAQSSNNSVQIFAPGTFPDVAAACSETLYQNITCSPELTSISGYEYGVFSDDDLNSLCVDQCKQSIDQYRSEVQDACNGEVWQDPVESMNVTMLSLVDSVFSGFTATCVKNSADQFCYTLLQPSPQYTPEQDSSQSEPTDGDCSECNLKTLQAQLNDPWEYDEDTMSDFSSLTSSCGVSTLSVATPTPVLPSSTTATPTPTVSCSGTNYTVSSTDTCDTIAEQFSVGVWNLQQRNNLDAACSDLHTHDQLCIDSKCRTYVPQSGDSCLNLASANNITIQQFLSWNPQIDPVCGNFNQSIGHHICLSNPLRSAPPTVTQSVTDSPAVPTADAPVPSDADPSSNTHCAVWYQVQPGDYCALVTNRNGISLDDFYFLNPEIDGNCTNLEAQVSYCVQPVGDITTYPGYGGSATTTAASTPTGSSVDFTDLPTATRPTFTSTPSASGYPLANGTRNDCFTYFDNSFGAQSCYFATGLYPISLEEFANWNPSLVNFTDPATASYSDCRLKNETRYCGQLYNPTEYAAPTSTSVSTQPPDDSGKNSTADCSDWYLITGGETCDILTAEYDISFEAFYTWNPSIGSKCQSLQLDTYYCVAGPGFDVDPTSTTSMTSATTSSVPGPTQTGMPSDCDGYIVAKSGDGCNTLAQEAGISLDTFESWNPAVGSDCGGLWPNYAYCTHRAGSPTTTSASTTASSSASTATSGPPASTQTGIPSDCDGYYVAQPNDSCYNIASSAGISLETFENWNPAVGSDCRNLWPNYAYCIHRAGSSTAPATTTTPPPSSSTAASATPTSTGAAPPGPTQSGIPSNCNKYVMQKDGVYCQDMANNAGISLNQLYSWNPALNGDCSGLWPGYAYCIGLSN